MNKKKYNYKGNRTIQDDSMIIKPGETKLNPLTLTIEKNESTDINVYFTKFHIVNNKIQNMSLDKSKKLNNASKYMILPPILIPSNDFLLMHNIINIDDLSNYINDNIEDNDYEYNNRIINCFIRENFSDLVKNNKILIDLYGKLFNIDLKNKNSVEKFIYNWFKNNNPTSFFLNLGYDLEKFLGI
jgi:hypothetical protein